jgi:PTH1 family peptidyl-tRNA hydrolase
MPAPQTAPSPHPIRLIVGLGNPGMKYAATRHNVGFMVLDRLAARWGVSFSKQAKWQALAARHGDWHLLKPQTFMNLSGESIGACCQFYKLAPEQVLVVYDDTALPLGKLRLRPGGSAGGHNGIRSAIAHLGTEKFPRLRVGIGASVSVAAGMTGHVLGRFAPEEQEAVDKSLDRAVEAVILATLRGLEAAMNAYNAEPAKPPAPESPPENSRPRTPSTPPASDVSPSLSQTHSNPDKHP